MHWFLNLAYFLFLLAVSPVLLYRMAVLGKYRDGWGQKFLGELPPLDNLSRRVWFHAVSVGEVLQLQSVLDDLRARRPHVEIVISTTTSTGLDVAREKFPDDVVCYFPLDFSWSVKRALKRIQPSAVVLVELELWPNFIFETTNSGIPLALINGRISDNSFRGYRRIRPLMRRLLNRFDVIAVQNEVYRQRIINLGANPEKLCVTGSVKFDHVETDRRNSKTEELRNFFGIGEADTVFIAGSTGPPEEELAIQTYQSLIEDVPNLRLILVPRHKERFEQVAQLVKMRGLPLIRRSDRKNPEHSPGNQDGKRQTEQAPVLLLDTLGELSACWGLADIAFVGGSLTNRGGQNMIEPSAFGAAVLFGPHTHNFRNVVDHLLANNAARVVQNGADLTREVRYLLQYPEEARQQGEVASRFVLSQQGATQKTVDAVIVLLSETIKWENNSIARAA